MQTPSIPEPDAGCPCCHMEMTTHCAIPHTMPCTCVPHTIYHAHALCVLCTLQCPTPFAPNSTITRDTTCELMGMSLTDPTGTHITITITYPVLCMRHAAPCPMLLVRALQPTLPPIDVEMCPHTAGVSVVSEQCKPTPTTCSCRALTDTKVWVCCSSSEPVIEDQWA